MLRARKLYKRWKKENKEFFKCGVVRHGCYSQAIQSLLNYWRMNNVTIDDVDLISDYIGFKWVLFNLVVSSLVSFALGYLVNRLGIIKTPAQFLLVSILGLVVMSIVSWWTFKKAKEYTFSTLNFCKNAGVQYKELYKDELTNKNKLVELRDKSLVEIPHNYEFIYDSAMTKTWYYDQAFKVSVSDSGRTYIYIWYSNKNYSTLGTDAKNHFVKLCKEQIGINWKNINSHKIIFDRLPTI